MAWYLSAILNTGQLNFDRELEMPDYPETGDFSFAYGEEDMGTVLARCKYCTELCKSPTYAVVGHVTGFICHRRFHSSDVCNAAESRKTGRLDVGGAQRNLYGNHCLLVFHAVLVGRFTKLKEAGHASQAGRLSERMPPLDSRFLECISTYLGMQDDKRITQSYSTLLTEMKQYYRQHRTDPQGEWNRPVTPENRPPGFFRSHFLEVGRLARASRPREREREEQDSQESGHSGRSGRSAKSNRTSSRDRFAGLFTPGRRWQSRTRSLTRPRFLKCHRCHRRQPTGGVHVCCSTEQRLLYVTEVDRQTGHFICVLCFDCMEQIAGLCP
jgi:hypothetical protein